MTDSEWTKILGWPGYLVYQCEIDEEGKTLKLWVRRKPGTKKLICSGCGRHSGDLHDATEREVRDLPWSGYQATVVVELHRVRCPECGPKMEKVAQLPSKAPFSKRFEESVWQACDSASARQVARRMGLPGSTVLVLCVRSSLTRHPAESRAPSTATPALLPTLRPQLCFFGGPFQKLLASQRICLYYYWQRCNTRPPVFLPIVFAVANVSGSPASTTPPMPSPAPSRLPIAAVASHPVTVPPVRVIPCGRLRSWLRERNELSRFPHHGSMRFAIAWTSAGSSKKLSPNCSC